MSACMAGGFACPLQGDVIGCFLHMPEGGRAFEKEKSVRYILCAHGKRPIKLFTPNVSFYIVSDGCHPLHDCDLRQH